MSATFLQTRYEEREQVKSLGARWDRTTKSWFVPDGQDIEPFRQWLRSDSADPRQVFSDELRKAGFRLDGTHPIMQAAICAAIVGACQFGPAMLFGGASPARPAPRLRR